jgi:hypothetical protein
MTVTVSPSQAKDLVIHAIKRKIVPMLHGSPSSSKSSIVRQIAEMANLEMIDIRLSQFDPVFLLGLPDINGDLASLIPFDMFPMVGMKLPAGKSGWLIFFDEFNSCNRSVAAACYKIILDRMIGQQFLHSKAHVVLAGNLATDNAIVNEMSTAMQSRVVHLQVEMTKDDWIKWAIEAEIDTRVITFIENRPSLLMKFDPNHDDFTYPCPRGYEFVSNIIKGTPFDRDLLPLVQGSIGEGVGLEFFNFCQLKDHLPSMAQVLKDPENCEIPEKPTYKYAMTGILIDGINPSTATKVMKYLERFPMEYCYLVVRMCIRLQPVLLENKEIDDWVTSNANKFYG